MPQPTALLVAHSHNIPLSPPANPSDRSILYIFQAEAGLAQNGKKTNKKLKIKVYFLNCVDIVRMDIVII